ncbi:MAG: rRNA maturation RNase YbeY [Haliscomenobacter sp.]|nr:rRNA maturation RNase YbeY [Haliscomenobacter sp.]MBK7475155.1 rRNA maturation RNase YbeY [Haliscomenobacter sp.]MBK8879696.1 rRNA maturation RNase YbeY [Haliscomenobacter sp.]
MSEDFPFFEEEADEQADPIAFFSEDVDFSLSHPDVIRLWIQKNLENQSCSLGFLNVVFCSDAYIHQMNVEYLKHDELTDIITFPYQDPPLIEGDLFISIDRVRENAQNYAASFEEELHRVIIHGVFHLCGFGDKSPEEAALMRAMEDRALKVFPQS